MKASSYEGIKAASMITPSLEGISNKLLAVLPFIKNVELSMVIRQSLRESELKKGICK